MKNTNSALLKLKIKSVYSEFQRFMELKNLPSFEIKLFNALKSKNRNISTSISYINDNFILNIEENMLTIYQKTITALLFHEFTHIFDDFNYLQDITYDNKKSLLHPFTEYHATQIQLMCACEFDSINDVKKLDESTIVYNGTYPKSIVEYINYLYQDYISTFNHYIEHECPPKNSLHIILHSIYFQSEIDFFMKYCIFDISKYINVEIAKILCGKNFCELINSINIKPQNTIEFFQKQSDLNTDAGIEIYQNSDKLVKLCPLL